MGKLRIFAALAVIGACGRLRFDPVGVLGDGSGADVGGDAAIATSCQGLAPTCGPLANAPCCDSPIVSGGMFYRSYDVSGDGMYPSTSYPATVSTFRLDTYEVTVGRFRQFVAAGMGTQANPPVAGSGARALNGLASQAGWDPAWNASLAADTTALRAAIKCDAGLQTWTDAPAGNENRPIVCITWYDAMAFCIWDGGYLPTEAESMYAASGGSQQRAYPWSGPPGSTAIDCTVTNYGGTSWPSTACHAAGASDVGSSSPLGDGLWGQADLGGNALEWALDWYAAPPPMPCDDCANLASGSLPVIRGGCYLDAAANIRAAFRQGSIPRTFRYNNVGVRCARNP